MQGKFQREFRCIYLVFPLFKQKQEEFSCTEHMWVGICREETSFSTFIIHISFIICLEKLFCFVGSQAICIYIKLVFCT